ncbi:hypothetical protein FB451DRAFT_1190360 [Mycena latifolia]|nr:hypothetical protein FB451DRAFT_1190360 [Mycena latifolia]
MSNITWNAWFGVCVTCLIFALLSGLMGFQMIVRKFTNYFNQIYKKSHLESLPSTVVKGNPLLKFSSVLSGRQLYARDIHDKIVALAKQRVLDTGGVLKEIWDGRTVEEKSEWVAKAEDECGDVAVHVFRNQQEFADNIHLAMRGLCQGGLLGDAEMLLFYVFRDEANGDLLAGTSAFFCLRD